MFDALFQGFLLSAVVGSFLGWLIHPGERQDSAVFYGRKLAAFIVLITTVTTLFRFPYPAPKGGTDAIVTWLAVTIPLGVLAFTIGAGLYAIGAVAKKIKDDGPEMLGSAIRKTSEAAHRVQLAASDAAQRVETARNYKDQGATATRCPKCNAENEINAKFCTRCATALARVQKCGTCGHDVDFTQRFCGNCGAKTLE